MDYKKFTVIDFTCDEYFQHWVLNPDAETSSFWNEWLHENGDKREIVEEARNLLLHIRFREEFPSAQQLQASLQSSLSIISALEEQRERTELRTAKVRKLWQVIKIAAVLSGIFLAGAAIWYNSYRNAKTTISTKYGEIKTVILPDSSVVTLNANSEISYFTHRRKSEERNLWLKGEAFLNVKHYNQNERIISPSDRFFVRLDDMDVEVLGTTFNVRNRRQMTDVVLESGKIRIAFKTGGHREIMMKPGERIVYNAPVNTVARSLANAAVYTSWTTKKLILADSPVSDIVQYIEDNYGYKVTLEDKSIGNKRMEGTMLLDNLDDVLFVMSTTLNVKIERGDSTLVFRTNK